jgi:hypothetical protein
MFRSHKSFYRRGAVLMPKPLSREDLRRKMDETRHTARVGEG